MNISVIICFVISIIIIITLLIVVYYATDNRSSDDCNDGLMQTVSCSNNETPQCGSNTSIQPTCQPVKSRESYMSGEHVAMADGLLVRDSSGVRHAYIEPLKIKTGTGDSDYETSDKFKINMDTGDSYTFGQLLALSGDYYWGKTQVSDFRGNDEKAMKQFLLNFNTLNNPFDGGDKDMQVFVNKTDNTSGIQAREIIKVINNETNAVVNAIQSGTSVRKAFEDIDDYTNFTSINITRKPGTGKYSSITSAAADSAVDSVSGGGRYLQLATYNNDHFANDARYTYMIGHTVALQQAVLGYLATDETERKSYYHRALAMDGMACHFLSDTFAAGHARTNSRSIRDGPGATLDWSSSVAGLLVKIQHDEENTRGLRVTNEADNTWITYGDKNLFRPENAKSRKIQQFAIQASINEIWNAYNTGVLIPISEYEGLRRMPLPGDLKTSLTPLGGEIGEIVYVDSYFEPTTKKGGTTCSDPTDCSQLGPPEIWKNVGTSSCTFGKQRKCQRVKNLNNYTPFWTVSKNKLWRRKSRNRDTQKGLEMERAYSALSVTNAYSDLFDVQPTPILPPTSEDDVNYAIQDTPVY